jgi:hypothetical protein
MARWSSLRDALSLSLKSWRLWVIQFAGNAVIFALFFGWLQVSEAHWWQLLFQALLILVIFAAVLVLHGGTLVYFKNAHENRAAQLMPAFRQALRHIFALAVCVFIVHIPWALSGHLYNYQTLFPGYLRSGFPAWLRRMISEPALDHTYIFLLLLLRWVILPGLLLPFLLFCADRGFRGFVAFRDWAKTVRSLAYWVALVVAALVGVYLVEAVMGWRPGSKPGTFRGEQVSFVFRQLLAYLLALFSWLFVASALGRACRGAGQTGA